MGVRTSVVGLASLLLLVLVTSEGCSSVPDITFDDSVGGSSGTPTGPCRATGAEICGDGLDNDCDGRADCADNACDSRLSCVDRVPADWQVVAFAEGARPPCPAGFGDSADVRSVQGGSGGASCACNCAGESTCADGEVRLAFGSDAACGGPTTSLDVTSDCRRLNGNSDFDVAESTFVKATAPSTPACNANPSAAPAPLRDGRTCVPSSRTAGGCGTGSSCVPRVGNGYQLCLQKSGVNACPSGFEAARSAGESAVDTRACSACTCTASPCAVEVKLHDEGDCGSTKLTVTTSGACTRVGNGGFNARGYETKVSGGCVTASPPQASGSLAFVGERTICCRSGGGNGG